MKFKYEILRFNPELKRLNVKYTVDGIDIMQNFVIRKQDGKWRDSKALVALIKSKFPEQKFKDAIEVRDDDELQEIMKDAVGKKGSSTFKAPKPKEDKPDPSDFYANHSKKVKHSDI